MHRKTSSSGCRSAGGLWRTKAFLWRSGISAPRHWDGAAKRGSRGQDRQGGTNQKRSEERRPAPGGAGTPRWRSGRRMARGTQRLFCYRRAPVNLPTWGRRPPRASRRCRSSSRRRPQRSQAPREQIRVVLPSCGTDGRGLSAAGEVSKTSRDEELRSGSHRRLVDQVFVYFTDPRKPELPPTRTC